MYWIIVFGAVVALAEGTPFAARIVNGDDTSIESYPYQVSVQFDGDHVCGGSILDKRHILTAAHCINEGEEAKDFMVRAGSSEYAEGGQLVAVSAIHSHEKFHNISYDYDVSVFVLAEDLEFNEGVETVTLADEDPEEDTECTVSGWGYTKENGEFSEVLQELDVPVIGREKCRKEYYNKKRITDRMFCAGYAKGKRDACQGDSGGPLVCNGVQAGIVSFGEGCARKNRPGVYASVAVLRQFIEEKMKL